MTIETEEPAPAPKPRRKKTSRQKAAAAGHSQKHREAKKAAGIPTGREIDKALLLYLIPSMLKNADDDGIKKRLAVLGDKTIQNAGWEDENVALKGAVASRLQSIITAAEERRTKIEALSETSEGMASVSPTPSPDRHLESHTTLP